MVVEVQKQVCDGYLLKWLFTAGLAWLEFNQEKVNQMNVFPVPDGDTGTNMVLTMRKANDLVATMDEMHVGIVSEQIARGALRGARGNSGVILSQLWRGFASALRGHEVFDAELLAHACRQGVEAGYKAVMDPVEGTMLTVARQATEALEAYVEDHDDLRGALDTLLAAAQKSLNRTPEMLTVLKKAGVLDSGGQGLVFLLEGMARMVHGENVPMGEQAPQGNGEQPQSWEQALAPDDEQGYGYDVQFLMHGESMEVDAVRLAIDAMGWSTLVVGDEALIKVHVHVHDPGEPISYAVRVASWIDDVVVENMQAQYEEYVAGRANSQGAEPTSSQQVDGIAVITVASGSGLQKLFAEGLRAAYVITGGQTMNPSTDDFLHAIENLDNDQIILVPNNRNIVLAAQQAASMARGRRVRVVPTTSVPQGISALLAYIDAHDAGEDMTAVVDAMGEAMRHVITGEVTRATRSAHIDGLDVEQGQTIGLLNGSLVAAGDTLTEVVVSLLRRANASEMDLITLYYGEDQDASAAAALAAHLADIFPNQHVETVYGGQPLYPYLISVE